MEKEKVEVAVDVEKEALKKALAEKEAQIAKLKERLNILETSVRSTKTLLHEFIDKL